MRTASSAPPGSLGELLLQLRREAGKHQSDVAAHLGVYQSYVSEVEAGKIAARQQRIPFERLARWLAFLGANDAARLEAFRLIESTEGEAGGSAAAGAA